MLTVNKSLSCRNDLLSPARRHRRERMEAAMAQAKVKSEDNRMLRCTYPKGSKGSGVV